MPGWYVVSFLFFTTERGCMFQSSTKIHACLIIIVGALMLTCVPSQTFSLRDARELCKRHRFKVLAVTSAAVIYMYTHKLVKKAIQDYNKPTDTVADKSKTNPTDYSEAFADAFIKATKLVGTIFKVFRATTCPDEGKITGDQWLDDFSQMA